MPRNVASTCLRKLHQYRHRQMGFIDGLGKQGRLADVFVVHAVAQGARRDPASLS